MGSQEEISLQGLLGPPSSMIGMLTRTCVDPDTGKTQALSGSGSDEELHSRNPSVATT